MRKLLFLVFWGLASIAHAETISFITEDYPPFAYRDGKDIKGATIDEINAIMADIGTPYTIDVMPWARAYTLAQTTPFTCAFVTAHNAERDKLFKWVEPLLIDHNILIKHTGSDVQAKDLDEARKYVVGTWRQDYTETLLRQANFPKIDVAADFKSTMKKLVSDRIDLMPISEFYFQKLQQEGQPIEAVTLLSSQPMGISCQKDFPDELLGKMQAALNRLIADGRQKQMFLQYGLKLDN
jgi:polar amino acid transport system substrate-binding protein